MSDGGKPAALPQHRLYGRRRGHRLRPGRAALVAELLPRLRIDPSDQPASLDPAALFDGDVRGVWLEIGFGAGEHLARQAVSHGAVGMIGCEPFIDGVASLLSHIAAAGISNIRIHDDDVRSLLPALMPASIERVFLLFNDPWPKTRHHGRRFVQPETVAGIARIMGDGAMFLIASDHAEYTRWCLRHLVDNGNFEWLAARPHDWRTPPPDWVPTRYETKARARGAAPYYLQFRRKPRGGARTPE